MKTRSLTALLAVLLVAGVIVLDQMQSRTLNPFTAPPVIAFGSGQASGGAHCTALPD